MPLTRFPNGLTACSTTALRYSSSATDGDIDMNNMYVAGTANITGPVVGQHLFLTYNFSTGSAAQTISLPTPFSGSIVNTWMTIGSVSAIVASYTVQVGSAGSVSVATVANTITTAYAQEALTTTTTVVTTASGLLVTRSAQGTAGDSAIGILIRRTA